MNSSSRALKRIMLLGAILIVMLALCGCRTRVTNNDEVSNVMYDEDGLMQEEYQLRRDELSLSKAKKPLFTGLGGPEEDIDEDYEYDDAQMLEDYNPEEFEDPYTDEDEVITADPPASGDSSSGDSSSGGRTVKGRNAEKVKPKKNTKDTKKDTKKDTAQAEVEVALDPNGGTCDVSSIKVKTDGNYGDLPVAVREGYTFEGWNANQDGSGAPVTSDTKVTATEKHTIYAQWKAVEVVVNKYTVSFDINGGAGYSSGGDPVQIEEGGSYATLPVPTREGYLFDGWFTAADGGDRVQGGDAFSANADQTLYAHWSEDPNYYYNLWTEDIDASVKQIKDEDKYRYQIYGDANGGDFLKASGMTGAGDDYEYIVFFGSKADAQAIENPDGKQILVIPKEAIKSSTKDSAKLLYRIKVFDKLYGAYGDDVNKAAGELGISDTEAIEVITPGE